MERSKFNVDKDKEKRTYNNIVFDSQLEMKYYRDVLCPAVESGEVTYFELQKKYELQPKYTHNGKTVLPIIYVADFYMEYADGHIEVVDTKENCFGTYTQTLTISGLLMFKSGAVGLSTK